MENQEKSDLIALSRQVGVLMDSIIEAGGEITPVIEEALAGAEKDLLQKVDAYAFLLDKLDAEEAYWKEQAEMRARVARGCANVRERLRDRVKAAIQLSGQEEIRGSQTYFRLVDTKPRLLVDANQLPPEFFIVETVQNVDRKKVESALSAGEEIPGARLEPGKALRKYMNSKR